MIRIPNRTSQTATYKTGSPNYVDVSSGAAVTGMVTFSAKATDDSWADGDRLGIVISKDDSNYKVWIAAWDATNEYLEVETEEESVGTISDSDSVTVTASLSQGLVESAIEKANNSRKTLTGNRTYYVRSDGNDSNDGLSNSSGGAFLTINKATEVVGTLDILNYDVTIQIADGTYTITAGIRLTQPCGTGNVILLGNETTPANVVITTSADLTNSSSIGGMIYGVQSTTVSFHIRGIKLTSTTSSGACFGIVCNDGFSVSFQNVDFGAFTSGASTRHIHCDDGSTIVITGNYTISGGAAQHAVIARTATMFGQSVTVTITGTPAFSSTFVFALFLAVISLSSITYTGSATGVRYLVSSNSVINTAGGGANYFPGNSAGSATTGGQYI